MFYLIMAVLASSAVAVIMRFGEKHIKNSFAMFMTNYFVCSVIAFLFIDVKNVFVMRDGLPFAAILALISGCTYLGCFILMKFNIGKNGVTLTSVFMKLGVIVPAVMAITVFGETPSALQTAGFAVAAAAIIVIYSEPSGGVKGNKKTAVFLLFLLILSGLTESMANIYDKAGTPELKNHYLFFNFLTATLLAAVLTAIKHKPISWKDAAFGVIIGIPNYFTSRCLLLSLGSIPAVVVYPIYNVGAIVLIGIAGMLLFREKLGPRKYVGFGLIAAALVLLNL